MADKIEIPVFGSSNWGVLHFYSPRISKMIRDLKVVVEPPFRNRDIKVGRDSADTNIKNAVKYSPKGLGSKSFLVLLETYLWLQFLGSMRVKHTSSAS